MNCLSGKLATHLNALAATAAQEQNVKGYCDKCAAFQIISMFLVRVKVEKNQQNS